MGQTMPVDTLRHGGQPLRGGFSLLEIVMVMVIITALAAVAVPRFTRSGDRYRLELAAHRLVADLELARYHARQTSQSVLVRIRTTPDTLEIPAMPGLNNEATYLTQYAGQPYRTDLITADFGGSDDVTFDGYGRPNSGGTVGLQVGSLSLTVALNADSGKAAVQ